MNDRNLLDKLDRWLSTWGVPLRIRSHIRNIVEHAGRDRLQHVHMRPTLFVQLQPVTPPQPADLTLQEVLKRLRSGKALPRPPE